MRNVAIDQAYAGTRVGVASRYSAMSAALALVLAPATASAGEPAPEPDQPTAKPTPDQQPIPEPTFPPVEIPPPQPEPEPFPEPEPEPEPTPVPGPEPIVAPIQDPPEPPGPTPERLARIDTQRKAGIGVMATGGVLVTAGFGMTLAFTLLGDQAQGVEEPITEDIERNDALARGGGILLASGVALAAVGGIIFANAERKKAEAGSLARVRVMPALGGLVVSGQF
jgi:hypothetical protein